MAKDIPSITLHHPTTSISDNISKRGLSPKQIAEFPTCSSVEMSCDRHNVELFATLSIVKQHAICEHESEQASFSKREREQCTCEHHEANASEAMPHIVRSRSQDRLWNEATRFYETVGEFSPLVQPGAVQAIIEDDSSCSGDEEEEPPKTQSDSECCELSLVPCDTLEESSPRLSFPATTRGFQRRDSRRVSFTHLLPGLSVSQDFVYKGISANPPEITKRGIARGNAAQIHRKAWLEVSDPKHRYGKNLRLYYRHWESLGCPTNNFFDWLDSMRDAADKPLPSLEDCPRDELDSDTVLYISDPEITTRFAVQLSCDKAGRCRVLDSRNAHVNTGPDGWIFVLRDGIFYGAQKVNSTSRGTKQRFHHSSFFGGKAVAAAGIFITDQDGYLTMVYPHSGHYRPGEADMQRTLFFLYMG